MRIRYKNIKIGFTLAEVLITLLVLGTLALVVLPALSSSIQDIILKERNKNVLFKLSQATDKMKALELLDTKYASTSEFVDELSKHLKIAKRCDNNHLGECFANDGFTTAQKQYFSFQNLKTTTDLGISAWGAQTEAIMLVDGASILLAYNVANCDPEKQFENIIYDSNQASSTLSCLSLVYDINGKSGPNIVPKDIRSVNNSIGEYKLGNMFIGTPVARSTFCPTCGSSAMAPVYYAGALAYCTAQGKHLATTDETLSIKTNLYGDTWASKYTTGSGIWYGITAQDKNLVDYLGDKTPFWRSGTTMLWFSNNSMRDFGTAGDIPGAQTNTKVVCISNN